MIEEREFFRLVKEVRECKDLLGEVLRRLGKMEYSGNMTFGDQSNNISKKSAFVTMDLHRTKDNIVVSSDDKEKLK